MNAPVSRKALPLDASEEVRAAAAKTAVQATFDDAMAADRLATLVDCTGIAHTLSHKHRSPEGRAMALSGELMDFALLQQPQSDFDVVILCLLMWGRSEIPYDLIEDEAARSTFDSVQTAIMNIGGYAASRSDPEHLKRLPEQDRGFVKDWLENCVGFDAAKAVFA